MEGKPISIEIRCLMRKILRFKSIRASQNEMKKQVGTNDWILVYLKEHEGNDVFQRDLEREFNITRSTASKNVDQLVDGGFIERVPVPGDARFKKLVLTGKAREILSIMRSDAEKFENELMRGFSDSEIETMRSYIGRMSANFDSYQERETND